MNGILSRHRRKIIVLFVTIGVGGTIYYIVKRVFRAGLEKVEQMGKQMEMNMLKQRQRLEEFERVKSETNSLVFHFITPMTKLMKELTDPKSITEALKTVRKRKDSSSTEMDELWENLKVTSLSRLLAFLYGTCILNVILKVQLHVLARESFEDSSKFSSETREQVLLKITSTFLSRGAGLKKMFERMNDSVRRVTSEWKMGTEQEVRLEDITSMLGALRKDFEGGDFFKWFNENLVPSDSTLSDIPELQQQLCMETLDILESPLVENLFPKSFDSIFEQLMKKIKSKQFKFLKTPHKGNKYLLTRVIVALLKEVSPEVVKAEPEGNDFIASLQSLEVVDSLCAEIFRNCDEDDNNLGMDLSSFGLTDEDIKSFQGLLSGDEGEMIKILQSLGSQENLLQSGTVENQ